MYTVPPKKMVTINILNILKNYSDMDHRLTQQDIAEILKKEYYMDVDRKTIKRNLMNLLDLDCGIDYTEISRKDDKGNTDIKQYISEDMGSILFCVLKTRIKPEYIKKEMHRYIPETRESDKCVKQNFIKYFYDVVLYKERKPGIYPNYDEHMRRVIVVEFF